LTTSPFFKTLLAVRSVEVEEESWTTDTWANNTPLKEEGPFGTVMVGERLEGSGGRDVDFYEGSGRYFIV
jgi:hypothetical protein